MHGDIARTNELIESIGLDPNRFVSEAKGFINKKAIVCRVCPECMNGLVYKRGLSEKHIVIMICPNCGKEFEYFGCDDEYAK